MDPVCSAVIWCILAGVSDSRLMDTGLFGTRAPRNGFQSLLPVRSIVEQKQAKNAIRKEQCTARETSAGSGCLRHPVWKADYFRKSGLGLLRQVLRGQ